MKGILTGICLGRGVLPKIPLVIEAPGWARHPHHSADEVVVGWYHFADMIEVECRISTRDSVS